jgi:hypothetical protein
VYSSRTESPFGPSIVEVVGGKHNSNNPELAGLLAAPLAIGFASIVRLAVAPFH